MCDKILIGIEEIRTPQGINLIVSNYCILPMKTIPKSPLITWHTWTNVQVRPGVGRQGGIEVRLSARLGLEPKSTDHESIMFPITPSGMINTLMFLSFTETHTLPFFPLPYPCYPVANHPVRVTGYNHQDLSPGVMDSLPLPSYPGVKNRRMG